MSIIAVYITHPSQEEANRISEHLIRSRLAACTNVFPITSFYVWSDELQDDSEWVSIVKSRPELWDKIVEEVELTHPYDVPCVARIDMQVNRLYEKYIRESTMDPAED